MGKVRTTETLREALFDALEKVKSGDLSVAEARAVCEASGRILDTVRIEMDYTELMLKIEKEENTMATGPLLLFDKAKESGEG